MDREIRLILRALEAHEKLADFIKRVEKTKYLIISFVKNLRSYAAKSERKPYI